MPEKTSLIVRLVRRLSVLFTACFAVLLIAMSAISTCVVRGDILETTYFISKPLLPKVILLIMALLVLRFVHPNRLVTWLERLDTNDRVLNRTRIRAAILIVLAASAWIGITQPILLDGQSAIQTAAEQLNVKNFSALLPGGFLSRHPEQIGRVLLVSVLHRIAGRDNYIFTQLIYAGMAGLTCFFLSRLAALMNLSGRLQIGIFAIALIFFPYLFQTTVLYSALPGLLLSVLAFYLTGRYEATPRIRIGILAALAMGTACLFGPNAPAFALALLIYSLLSAFKARAPQRLILSGFLILAMLFAAFLPKAILRKITGIEPADAISPHAYLTMGAQDGERAPGWENGYADRSFDACGYDTSAQRQMAISDFSDRLAHFKADPAGALRFFLQKTASQWNNPTFEVFWYNEILGTCIRPADWVNRISRPTGVDFVIKLLNPLQFLLFFLILIGLFTAKTGPEIRFLPLLAFLSGFLFQAVGVAGCQNTLCCFALLFPYAACGAGSLRAFISHPVAAWKRISRGRQVFLILILACVLLLIVAIGKTGFLTGSNAEYAAYLADVRINH